MTNKLLRIGTRESRLAVWQANKVKDLLAENGVNSELVYIKSEGDIDLQTPLYEIGVQGIFTRSLDIALLNNRIDIAVHSMKDVPTQLPKGIIQSAVLKRASYKDLLVFGPAGNKKKSKIESQSQKVEEQINNTTTQQITPNATPQTNIGQRETNNEKRETGNGFTSTHNSQLTWIIATSSIRRKAQWLNRYPNSVVENLRGNVITRLQKVKDSNWHGAIFAAAGLDRIGLRPVDSIELDWMLPAPAQGAIVVVCRESDNKSFAACQPLNDEATALCTGIEKAFLRTLLGGCSTPISALAVIENEQVIFRGNIFSTDGKQRVDIEKKAAIVEAINLGETAAKDLLANGGQAIADTIQHAR